jgi:hypothetical protein
MSDLLKEAIADAKAVRETALANAKMALEEAFTPHLKSMLSAKLAEDEIEEDDDVFEGEHEDEDEEDEEEKEEAMHSPRREDDDEEGEDDDPMDVDESEIIEIDGVKYAPIVSEDEVEEGMHDGEKSPRRDDDDDEGEDDDSDIDESDELDLEAVIKELEEELEEAGDPGDEEESVNEEEITEGDDEEEKVDEEVVLSELNEYKEAVVYLKDKLHEVNILNAKLLYTNKLFKEYALSNDQKLKIVETFDRAQTTREIKLVYTTLAESFTGEKTVKKEVVKEFASKKSGGTAPKAKIITEEVEVADRFRKLAGII